MLGAPVVEGEDDGKFFPNVGSGLTDDMRKDVWAAQDSVVGQLVERRADEDGHNLKMLMTCGV